MYSHALIFDLNFSSSLSKKKEKKKNNVVERGCDGCVYVLLLGVCNLILSTRAASAGGRDE